jgi:hypothetical protein
VVDGDRLLLLLRGASWLGVSDIDPDAARRRPMTEKTKERRRAPVRRIEFEDGSFGARARARRLLAAAADRRLLPRLFVFDAASRGGGGGRTFAQFAIDVQQTAFLLCHTVGRSYPGFAGRRTETWVDFWLKNQWRNREPNCSRFEPFRMTSCTASARQWIRLLWFMRDVGTRDACSAILLVLDTNATSADDLGDSLDMQR